MNKRLLNWLCEECPFYHFWHPQSGLFGGIVMGIIIGMLIVFVFKLFR